MENTIKTLALLTTGLVVGVVVGRVKEKKTKIDDRLTARVEVMDLPELKKLINDIKRVNGSEVYVNENGIIGAKR